MEPRRSACLASVACLLVAGACVSTRRPLPVFDPAQLQPSRTRVQVFDPAGTAQGEPVVVGRRPVLVGKLRASPWARQGKAAKNAAARGQPAGKPDSGKQKTGEQGQEKAAKQGDPEKGDPEKGDPKQAGPPQDPKPDPAEQEQVGAEDLYSRFGPNIIIQGDNRVTKTYYVDNETGQVLDTLLALTTGAAPAAQKGKPSTYKIGKGAGKKADEESILDSLLGQHRIVIQRVPSFDQQKSIGLEPRTFKGSATGAVDVQNDLVLVTSTPDGLEAFEETMDLFYRSVPQVLIEAKVVEISWGDTLDIGISQTDSKTPTIRTVGKGSFIKSLVSKFPNTSTTSTGTGGTSSEGLLTIGGIHDNLELNAQLELLQTKVKSDIVSHPKIAVRNGGTALIDTTTNVPYPEAKIIGNNTQTSIKFAKVGVSMQIRPVVAPGEIVVLQIYASVDAITGFANTDPIPTPEISTRRAITSVHVPSGKTTVIGGLITKTSFENEAQIPILGDIPLLGYLFRSTFIQKGSSEVVFMITPRIIYGFEGSDPLEEDYTSGGF